MEAALRRRLEGVVDVQISQRGQTASVTFGSGARFTPGAFSDAVAEAGVEVLRLTVDACGATVRDDHGQWLSAGPHRFLLGSPVPQAATVCVSGWLQEHGDDWRLDHLIVLD